MEDSSPFMLEFLRFVVKVRIEVLKMKKRIGKVKKEGPKTAVSDLYDCCWYEPSCNVPCCGGVCCSSSAP